MCLCACLWTCTLFLWAFVLPVSVSKRLLMCETVHIMFRYVREFVFAWLCLPVCVFEWAVEVLLLRRQRPRGFLSL